jgi:hypothetical protein
MRKQTEHALWKLKKSIIQMCKTKKASYGHYNQEVENLTAFLCKKDGII